MKLSLISSQRIRKRSVFEAISASGKKIRGKVITLLFTMSCDNEKAPEKPCFAVKISRKISLRANVRNLWKRRIRESFRRNQEQLRAGYYLFWANGPQKKVPPYHEIEADLLNNAARAGAKK